MDKNEKFSLLKSIRNLRLRKTFFIIVGLLLFVIGILAYYIPNSMEHDRLATIDIGNEIIEALQTYFDDNGHYPTSLEELVSKYLKEIKKPLWGDSGWIYSGIPSGLKVGYKSHGGLYPMMIYDPKHGWICDL
ncbi:MAG: hypothetical protein KAS96_00055 [Planctomycetes bacterium]|nr:hypothetical protein [Planctomycetota bacterium]